MDTQSDILEIEYTIEEIDPIIESDLVVRYYFILNFITPQIALDSCKFANNINVSYYYKKYTEDPIPYPIITNHDAIISNDFILMEMIDGVSIKEDIVYKEIKKNNIVYRYKISSKNSFSFSQTLTIDEECEFIKYKEDRFIILREYENGEIQHFYGCSITDSYKVSEENNNKYNIEIDMDKITKKYPKKSQANVYLEKITVTNPETSYSAGEFFKEGSMVVTATMSDGTSKIVNNYLNSIIKPLTKGIKPVLITYIENNIVKTNFFDITVT